MAVVQSSYAEGIQPAYAGMVANMTNWDADSRICETSAGIAFGVAVGLGTADNGAIVGAGAAAQFVGITVRDPTLVIQSGQTVDKYQQYDTMAVLTEGDIWVTVGASVTDGADVSFVASTGVLSSAGSSGTQFIIAGARWMTTADTGELAIVRLGGALPSA